MIKNIKKKAPKDEYNWLTTYGDLVTLLLVFFVLLVAFSQISTQKFKMIAKYIAESFGNKELLVSNERGFGENIINLNLIASEIRNKIKLLNLTGDITVTVEGKNIIIRGKGDTFFPLGSAKLTPKIKNFLRAIAPILKSNNYKISVEGHTDDLPIHSKLYPSNWELSTARACSVIRYLTNVLGMDPHRFRAVGYAQFKPLYIPIPANRKKNRRVEIIIHADEYKWE